MRVSAIPSAGAAVAPSPPGRGEAGFAATLRRSIDALAGLQAAADLASQNVAAGDLAHLHQAVIAMQEAGLALDLVVSVRNHVVEGIQELLRTQV